MIIVQKEGATLAWSGEYVTEVLSTGTVLIAARRFRLSQSAAIAHVEGAHLLQLFRDSIAYGEQPLGEGNIVHARFMLHVTGEPELRGVAYAVFPPGTAAPRLGTLISLAASLVRKHGFEA